MRIQNTTPSTQHHAAPTIPGPMLRELTYRYEARRTPAGDFVIPALVMHQPNVVAPTLTALLRDEPVEVFGILCLTTKFQPICWHTVSRGGLNTASVEPREVFRPAMLACAAVIIAAHYIARHIMRLMCPESLCAEVSARAPTSAARRSKKDT